MVRWIHASAELQLAASFSGGDSQVCFAIITLTAEWIVESSDSVIH